MVNKISRWGCGVVVLGALGQLACTVDDRSTTVTPPEGAIGRDDESMPEGTPEEPDDGLPPPDPSPPGPDACEGETCVGLPGVGGSGSTSPALCQLDADELGQCWERLGAGNSFASGGLRVAAQSVAFAGDVNYDGEQEILVGTGRGSHVLLGPLNVAPVLESGSAPGFELLGSPDGPVASAGDFNGDQYGDVMVGNPSTANGAAYIVFGKPCTDDREYLPTTTDQTLSGIAGGVRTASQFLGGAAGDRAGASVASVGDFNDDGYGDVVIGAPGAGSGEARAGKVYLVFGKECGGSTGGVGNIDNLNELVSLGRGWPIAATQLQAPVGEVVASAGDFDDDGFDDLLIASPGFSLGVEGENAGAVYLLYGRREPPTEELDLALFERADAANRGEGIEFHGAAGERAGSAVSSAGDFNRDGFGDFVVTMLHPGRVGSARIVFGQPRGSTRTARAALADTPGLTITGIALGRAGAMTASPAGDFNGDGFDDIVIAAPGADVDGIARGIVSVIFGGEDQGTLEFQALPALQRAVFFAGAEDNDRAGTSVAGGGDVNGDGRADVLVGARGPSPNTGLLYILLGSSVE